MAQYFEVDSVDNQPASHFPSGDVGFKAAKQELQQALKQAEEEERRRSTEPEESKEPSGWLRRIRQAVHLEGLDRKELRELVALVEDNEPGLQVLCKAFDQLIQDSQYYAVREVVGLEALLKANKNEVNKETQMLFDSWIDISTPI